MRDSRISCGGGGEVDVWYVGDQVLEGLRGLGPGSWLFVEWQDELLLFIPRNGKAQVVALFGGDLWAIVDVQEDVEKATIITSVSLIRHDQQLGAVGPRHEEAYSL